MAQRRVAATVLALALGCGSRGPAVVVETAQHGPARVQVELARTPAEQERGLMYRTSMATDQGMLFLFPDDTDRAFWMKNTLIPLDMIFIDSDGRVAGIRERTTPLSETPISVGKPSKWVLEVNGGWSRAHGVAAGDRVGLEGATP